MKKKLHSISKHLPPVKLYLDDVNEIVSRLQSLCSKIEYSTKNYEFESLDELKQNCGSNLKELAIQGRSPYISVDIRKHDVHLYTSGESETTIGLYYSLKEFLQQKSGWYSKFLNIWLWGTLLWIFLIVFSNVIKELKDLPDILKYFYIFLSFIFFFFLLSLLNRWKGSTIYLENRYKVSNFWERNKDKIITTIIGALIGTFLTILFRFIFK